MIRGFPNEKGHKVTRLKRSQSEKGHEVDINFVTLKNPYKIRLEEEKGHKVTRCVGNTILRTI